MVAKILLRKLMKIVPTIEQSGMYPQVPKPIVAIPVSRTVSRLYPYPNTWMLATIDSRPMNFLIVGRTPCGGLILGYPSVSKITEVFLKLHLQSFIIPSPILIPSQILVEPPALIFLRACFAINFPFLFILVRSRLMWAALLNGTNANISSSPRVSIMVLIECFTKSNLVNPFSSIPLVPSTASVSMDPDTSITQMIAALFLLEIACQTGDQIVTFTTTSPDTTVESISRISSSSSD